MDSILDDLVIESVCVQGCIDVSEKPVTHLKLTPVPHTGVGREEEGSCVVVVPLHRAHNRNNEHNKSLSCRSVRRIP